MSGDTSLVSVVGLESYADASAVEAAVRASVEALGGMSAFVKAGQKVLLKPNLVAPSAPELAVTTHPAIVRAVIHLVQEAGGVCYLGDGPGVGGTLLAARGSGLEELCRQTGTAILEFAETAVFENDHNRLLKHLPLTAHLKEMDVLISLPKLKTHCQMAYTGALKNQYGLVPGAAKGRYHFRFQDRERMADLMVDINRTARPALAIMDAVEGMEGPGPSGGTPRKIGLVMASADLTALDSVGLSIIGLKVEDVPVSVAARRGGYGRTSLEDIQVSLQNTDGGAEVMPASRCVERLRIPDYKLVSAPLNIMRILPLPQFLLRWLRSQMAPRPTINPARCIKCGRCERGCPVEPAAIHPLLPGGPKVNDRTCIRCYCCHEFCPVKAIDLKKSLLARIVNFEKLATWASRGLGWLRMATSGRH